MKRLFSALFIIFIFLILPFSLHSSQDVIESDPFDIVIPNAITSSVSLVIIESHRKLTTCTGVVIKNTPTESIVLTAKHCLVFEGDIYVESFLVEYIGVSYKSDLAYLVLNRFIPYKTPVRISNSIPKKDDRIFGIGYPNTKLYTTKGTMFVQTPKEQYAFIDIIKGCSGGGVFNTDGELIGIMVRHYSGIGLGILERLEDIHTIINVNKLLE